MTHAEMLASLPPPRLPVTMAILSPSEILALLGLGMAFGLLIGVLVLPLTRQRDRRQGLRLRDLRSLPMPERLLELSRLLGCLPRSLRAAAYGAAPPPSDRQVERAARRLRPWLR